MMQTACSSEILVTIHQAMFCLIPEDHNLKSFNFGFYSVSLMYINANRGLFTLLWETTLEANAKHILLPEEK